MTNKLGFIVPRPRSGPTTLFGTAKPEHLPSSLHGCTGQEIAWATRAHATWLKLEFPTIVRALRRSDTNTEALCFIGITFQNGAPGPDDVPYARGWALARCYLYGTTENTTVPRIFEHELPQYIGLRTILPLTESLPRTGFTFS